MAAALMNRLRIAPPTEKSSSASETADNQYGLGWRIPGGSSGRKWFSSDNERSGYADKLVDKHGDDIELEWSDPQQKSFRDFVRLVAKRDTRSIEKRYGTGYVTKAAMNETSGVAGGYLVPREYSVQLLRAFSERGFVYSRANVVPMGSAQTDCPVVDATTAQAAGTAPYFGGVLYTWGIEDASLTQSEPAFRQVSLRAWDLIGRTLVSNDWLQDTGAEGEDKLVTMFGDAAAWYAEYAFFRGTGSGDKMPLGILNAPCTLSVTRAVANQIAAADISGMAAKLMPYGWRNGIWAAHPTTLSDICKLSVYNVNNGNVGAPGCAGTLLTLPLFVTDKLPALGTKGDLTLLDPSMYAIGNRQEVLIDVSSDVPGASGFLTNQTWFRVWMRVDGKPVLSSYVTLPDGSTTASSMIALN